MGKDVFFWRRSKAGPSSSILASVKSAGRLCGGPAAPSVGLVFRANNERLFACCASLLSAFSSFGELPPAWAGGRHRGTSEEKNNISLKKKKKKKNFSKKKKKKKKKKS